MPLYIRDEHINDLALELQKATGAPSKTRAVQAALEKALAEARKARSIEDIAAAALAIADAMGPVQKGFDMKRFTDSL